MQPSYPLAPEVIAGIVGVALSLILHFVPRLNTAWESFDSGTKRLNLGAFSLAAAVAVGWAACGFDGQCTLANGWKILEVAFLAWGGNQAAYALIREFMKWADKDTNGGPQ